MPRKRIKELKVNVRNLYMLNGRKPSFKDREAFSRRPRNYSCLFNRVQSYLRVPKLDQNFLKFTLGKNCLTIEHQIIALRELIQLTQEDYEQRFQFTKAFLTCLYNHHDIAYEGILFGSTVNGLGFRDSDVDLRLRPLKNVGRDLYEPVQIDDITVHNTLRNIAYQTTKCCPALGEFVPSSRCPVAKLTFYDGNAANGRGGPRTVNASNFNLLQEGLKYDVSLAPTNYLGSFNSIFLRFLCHLEPKFHLLATVIRYWSNVHQLIVPGYLSSYALVNMLIFFCQTVEPPLLPCVNHMRDLYLNCLCQQEANKPRMTKKAMTQLEWHCIVCLRKELYTPSTNSEPLSVLLLKFFEFYLSYPYSTHILTIRPGQALTFDEFKASNQYHPRLPLNGFLNIQDPFELKHNLTSGMQGKHFRHMMVTFRFSYERLFKELMNNFNSKVFHAPSLIPRQNGEDKKKKKRDPLDWGLNAIFMKLTDQELKDA